MNIVSSNIIINRSYGSSGGKKIREEHTDINGNKFYKQYIADAGFDTNSKLAENAILIDGDLQREEINRAISAYESGTDPLYHTNGDKITPDYQTWEELATSTIRDFLHRIDIRDLAAIESVELTMSLVDRKIVYGMTAPQINAVDQNVNDAVDIVAQQNVYEPPYVDGVKQ